MKLISLIKQTHLINLFILLLINLSITYCFSQNKIQTLKTNQPYITIKENEFVTTTWWLDKNAKPDVYTTSKNPSKPELSIYTEFDTLIINLANTKNLDFYVIKNDSDTCAIKIKKYENVDYSNINPPINEIIPFDITPNNNIQLSSILNNKDSINLHFDTGATDFLLTKYAINKYLNPNNQKLSLNDISKNSFKIANLEWSNQQVYPVEITAQGNDGLFGWYVFDGKILEIDYDQNKMFVHSKLPRITEDYEKFDIEYLKDQFRIKIKYVMNNEIFEDYFLFDTGFQKALMFDQDILTKKNIEIQPSAIIKTSVLLNSQNKEIPMKTFNLEKLIFGRYTLNNIPSELNNYNKPTGYSTHFLGGDVIKKFNLILDFQNNHIYMRPNKLYYADYYQM